MLYPDSFVCNYSFFPSWVTWIQQHEGWRVYWSHLFEKRCIYDRNSFWSFIRTQGHEWHLYIRLSLNRYRDVVWCKNFLVPTHNPPHPRNWTQLQPASSRLASESPAASCQKSWSSFQRSPNIRRDWRPHSLRRAAANNRCLCWLRQPAYGEKGAGSCQVMTC